MSDFGLVSRAMFEGGDEAAWLELVSKSLKGGSPKDLEHRLYGDLSIKPLYRKSRTTYEDVSIISQKDTNTDAQPGSTHLPWDIRQTFSNSSLVTTNSEILRDLERGVSSVEIKLANKTKPGVHISSLSDLETAIEGVDSSIATIALDHQGYLGLNASAILASWIKNKNENSEQKIAFNIDPTSVIPKSDHRYSAFRPVANLVEILHKQFPEAFLLRSDARIIHEAGGSEVQELGVLIASAIETVRELDKQGIPPEISARTLLLTVSVSSNYGVECAKIRAARRLWQRCLEILGISNARINIQGVTSRRMLTQYDPWTNIIRNTCACFGAIIGGCDTITVESFTDALGVSSELGRRVARNTQIISMEESHLGRVTDPVSGSWFVEELTEDFANKGWGEFQRIEQEGGYSQSKRDHRIQSRVQEIHQLRQKSIATGKKQIIGISAFPSTTEVSAPIAEHSESKLVQGISNECLNSHVQDSLTDNAFSPNFIGLESVGLADEFEFYRSLVDRHTERTGKRPSVLVATIGERSEFSLRLDFTRNFFSAAGIVTETIEEGLSAEQIATRWRSSNCEIVCLCGSDKRYELEAETVVRTLKNSGAKFVYLSGRFSCDGIDQSLFLGQNVIEVLESTLPRLGVAV